jgi:hypothetical protein
VIYCRPDKICVFKTFLVPNSMFEEANDNSSLNIFNPAVHGADHNVDALG